MDLYWLTLTMFKMTKGALIAQSSKQMCIILRIVRILSPTNNSAANSTPGERGCKEHVAGESAQTVCVCVSICVSLNLCCGSVCFCLNKTECNSSWMLLSPFSLYHFISKTKICCKRLLCECVMSLVQSQWGCVSEAGTASGSRRQTSGPSYSWCHC